MFTFEVWQDGIMVASASANDKERARREAMHYLMQYAQNGPATLCGPDTEITVEHRKS